MTETTETTTPESGNKVCARNKALVFAALAEAGIHRVTVDYDGSGDSGQIENVEAWNAPNERMPFPSGVLVPLVSNSPDHPFPGQNLAAAVESIAWDYLDHLYYGWENNDGAFGTFVFDVPDRTITLEHRARFTDVDISTYEF